MKKLILLMSLFLAACGQIDTGHRGVFTHFGEVDEQRGSVPEGLYWYFPIGTSLTSMDTRLLRKESETNTYTRDIQQANIKYVINYHLEQNHAHTMLKEVGHNWEEKILPQAVEGVLKQVVGLYDSADLIANRAQATQKIQDAIAANLKPKHVTVDSFQMTNIQYLKDYEKAVEAKVIATQKALEAQNNTKTIQEVAKQTVITAQANAEAMRIRAQALQANPKLVQYEAVQKWDGHLPQYNLSSAVPFLNLQASDK